MLRNLHEDDAQSFIDVIDEARFIPTHHREIIGINTDTYAFCTLGTTRHTQPFATDPEEVSQIIVQDVWPPHTHSDHHESPRAV